METGTLDERRQVGFDALYAEAKKALSRSANELRALTERLRESYAEGHAAWQLQRDPAGVDARGAAGRVDGRSGSGAGSSATAEELARARQMLDRLQLAARDVEQTWLFLERGQDRTPAPVTAAAGVLHSGRTLPMHILEAQESERARLAAELHDGPAQALANAVFQTEVVDRALLRDRAAARDEVRALRGLLERELEEVRDYINQLRPALRHAGGLSGALIDAAGDLEQSGVHVETRLEAPVDALDDAERAVVLRIAQEALRNARKHSGAGHAWLRTMSGIGADGPEWMLEVADDGRGFDPEEIAGQGNRRHFGLRFMRERAELIGARLDVEAAPGAGTRVRLTIGRG